MTSRQKAPRKTATAKRPSTIDPSPHQLARLVAGEHAHPHELLGAHPATVGRAKGIVVRSLAPDAERCECVLADGQIVEMPITARGNANCFSAFLPKAEFPITYRFRFHYADGTSWERDDPYRFLPTVSELDLHLFNEGTHRQLWKKLGANLRTVDGVRGASFAVWAPNARRVSVVGDFCNWDGRMYPMRVLGSSGVFELFVPGVEENALYKFEILTREGELRLKTDPFARKIEQHPGTASIVVDETRFQWRDDAWLARRKQADPVTEPISIYEVHLGSWARVPEEGNRALSYREIAPKLAKHVKSMGFTHIELMPVMEHPFYGSWGYQVSGYYAPTSRFGSPDDFRHFVQVMHEHDIGVILDWVPAHFPKDDFALRRFDGTALFEHEDPRLGEHPDWGTLIFNYGRNEVRNFLVANAVFWIGEFHIDGLRVDAVASMLYLDYSRKAGEWLRNVHGGRENLEAIQFLREFNRAVHEETPGAFTVAEESTAWGGVTKPIEEGGLGFTFKWNMGWMHDTLKYFEKEPIHRRFHQDQLTFAMVYEYSERFIMPLSHDEVVHLKGSLLTKMAGDEWQKLANLRLLLAYMFTRPGKKLLFMGTELAPWDEWNHEASLDWNLPRDDGRRESHCNFVARLAHLYRERPSLWRQDHHWEGFSWIDVADRDNSVISYARHGEDEHTITVLNLTPVPREGYRIGVPEGVVYETLLDSDDARWGGSSHVVRSDVILSNGEAGAKDLGIAGPAYQAEATPFHGYEHSIVATLPPLGALILGPRPRR